jgi:RNA polymerase sigma-70 factor (ECF subfamily)
MFTPDVELSRGLSALRIELRAQLGAALAVGPSGGWLRADAVDDSRVGSWSGGSRRGAGPGGSSGDHRGGPTAEDQADADRLVALVDLARGGDADAFGLLYDHYHASIYRFVYYRVGSVPLAEDLVSETFFRALRSMQSFRWQGKDFGAWLMTIARNLTTDHFKAGRTRLEYATEDMSRHEGSTDSRESPEETALAALTNEMLLAALQELPHEQQECLIMRFLQSLSIAETAKVLGRTEGAVKQLQLRAVRNLAKRLPEGLR